MFALAPALVPMIFALAKRDTKTRRVVRIPNESPEIPDSIEGKVAAVVMSFQRRSPLAAKGPISDAGHCFHSKLAAARPGVKH